MVIKPEIIWIRELEETISVLMRYETNKRFIGSEVKTNKERTNKFGYGDDTTLDKIDELEIGGKVVVGFRVHVNN